MIKWIALALVTVLGWTFPQASREALRALGSVGLPNVEGRIDHLGVDLEGHRLFVAALGNNTLEVVDLNAMRVIKSIGGLSEPQGIRYLPDQHRVVVATGGDGFATFFEVAKWSAAQKVKLSGDADNVRYDPQGHHVYVGYASGALAVLDAADARVLGTIRLAGHPEAFQLETSGPRIFVNVPSAGHIAVVDRDSRMVTATWPVTGASANYPLALDETRHRLFVGCRTPARMLVYDTISGRQVTSLDIVGDTDDLFYDATRQRLYVAGGQGSITVIEQQDADHYHAIQTLPTAPGARTALLVPELSRLYLAVPHRGAQPAEIRIYAVLD